MRYNTLIDVNTLHAHLNDPHWVVVDCRFNLMDAEAGRRAYRESHLPGARYAHLDEDLSSPITPTTGRHPLPDPGQLARKLGEWGIGPETQVVAYDDMGGMLAAARLWWLLRWLGHQAAAVLNGGFPAWQRAGLPLTTEPPTVQPTVFTGQPDDRLWLTTAQILALPSANVLLDARTSARFRGEMEPIDPVAAQLRFRRDRLPQFAGNGDCWSARLAAVRWFLERVDPRSWSARRNRCRLNDQPNTLLSAGVSPLKTG